MKKYEINNAEYYEKGDLAGYINGYITFGERDHEFLYRVSDPSNGNDYKLVTIDYGYNVPNLDEMWDEIERELYAIAKAEEATK